MAHAKMFGRPGNGAPTVDIRKKKFTEHQLDKDVKKGEELNVGLHPVSKTTLTSKNAPNCRAGGICMTDQNG